MIVSYARLDDKDWLIEADHPMQIDWIVRCLNNNEYLIAKKDNKPLGFIRFSYFWGSIPYMDMIRVNEENRGKGIGKMLFQFWEDLMKKSDAKILMTSAMEDEPKPQKWHERNGFKKSGELTFGKVQNTKEIFFIKDLD